MEAADKERLEMEAAQELANKEEEDVRLAEEEFNSCRVEAVKQLAAAGFSETQQQNAVEGKTDSAFSLRLAKNLVAKTAYRRMVTQRKMLQQEKREMQDSRAALEKENQETGLLEKQADQASRFVRDCHSPRPDAAPALVPPPAVQSVASDDGDEQHLPVAVPSPAMIALGLIAPTGSRPHTPAERDAAKVVAREFTDLLFRPSSAPAARSPRR